VDQVTLLLKIVLNKCFVNKYNLYNQVGMIAINCMGEMYQPGGLTLPPPSSTLVTAESGGGSRSVSARAPLQF